MADAVSNLALVANFYKHYNAGSFEPVEAALAEDVVWYSGGADGVVPWAGRWEGPDGVRAYREALNSHVEIIDYTLKEHLADEDQVALWCTVRLCFKGSAAEHKIEKVDQITIRDGKLVKFWEIYDTAPVAAALAANGKTG